MKKETDPDYVDTTETSLVLKDERYTSEVQEVIEEAIMEGATPLGAALEAGITKDLFNSWMRISDQFRDWIEGLQALHLSRRRRKINQLIDNVEGKYQEGEDRPVYNSLKAAELNMKYLQSADKDFGSRHQKITTQEAGADVITPESKKRVEELKEKNKITENNVVEKAGEIANELPNS